MYVDRVVVEDSRHELLRCVEVSGDGQAVSILVDRRTGSKDLIALLPRGYGELTELEYGDAVIVGYGPDGPVTEAFERKRLSDALSCLMDGRFAAHQLRGLRNDYDFVWLVIEDEIRADP